MQIKLAPSLHQRSPLFCKSIPLRRSDIVKNLLKLHTISIATHVITQPFSNVPPDTKTAEESPNSSLSASDTLYKDS